MIKMLVVVVIVYMPVTKMMEVMMLLVMMAGNVKMRMKLARVRIRRCSMEHGKSFIRKAQGK